MHSVYEFVLPLIVAILALFPLVVLLATYKRVPSRRVLLAALAFLFFVAKGVVLFFALVMEILTSDLLEWVEFGADAIIVSLFAASFFIGSTQSGSEDVGE